MSKVKIGIIGVQGYGSTYFETLKEIGVEIVAICDLNQERAQELAEQYQVPYVWSDYRELVRMEELDAVFISTPHYLHYPMTMEALTYKKHVFCEKPLAIHYEEAKEMADTARKLGLKMSCHYNRRQSLHVKVLQDLIKKQVLGDIYQCNVKWMSRYTKFMFSPDSAWRVSKEKAGGGILIGRGSHMIDAVWFVLGRPRVLSVYACTNNRLTGFDVDDYAQITMKLEGNCVIHLEFSYEMHLPEYQSKLGYELFGTKGGVSCQEIDGRGSICAGRCEFPDNQWTDFSDQIDLESCMIQEPRTIIEDFIDSIVEDREPYVTAEDGAYITRIMEAAYQSAETGKEVILS